MHYHFGLIDLKETKVKVQINGQTFVEEIDIIDGITRESFETYDLIEFHGTIQKDYNYKIVFEDALGTFIL